MQDIHILRCDERNLVVTPFIGAPIWFRVLDTPLTIPFSLPTTPLRLRHAPIVLRLHPTALLEDVQSAQKKHTAQLHRDLTFQLGRSPESCFRFKHRSIRLVSQIHIDMLKAYSDLLRQHNHTTKATGQWMAMVPFKQSLEPMITASVSLQLPLADNIRRSRARISDDCETMQDWKRTCGLVHTISC